MRKANSSNSILVRSIVRHGKVASLVGMLMASASTEVLANCTGTGFVTCDDSSPNPYNLNNFNVYYSLTINSGTVNYSGGALNFNSGSAVINGPGVLNVFADNTLNNDNNTYVNSGAVLNLEKTTQSYTGTIYLANGTIQNGTIQNGSVGGNAISSTGGYISGISGVTLNTSSGTTYLQSNNSFSNSINVNSGTTILQGSNISSNSINVNGGTLQWTANNNLNTGIPNLTINSGGTVNLNGFLQQANVASVNINGGTLQNGTFSTQQINLNSGTISNFSGGTGKDYPNLVIGALGGTLNNVSDASLAVGYLYDSGGTITLTGNNAFNSVSVSGFATLLGGNNNAFTPNISYTINSGAINLGGYQQSLGQIYLNNDSCSSGCQGSTISNGTFTGTNAIFSNGGYINSIGGSTSVTISQPQQFSNNATTYLTGSNTYTGATQVSFSLQGGNANAFSANSLTTINAGGVVNLGGYNQTINNLTLAGGTLQNGNLTGAITSNGGTVNGIGGTASLTASSGTTTLSGTNSYSGSTTVNNGGTLTFGAANSASANSAITVGNQGTLNLNTFNMAINNLTLAGGTITNGSLVNALNSTGGFIYGLGGNSSLINNGGTTTFTGANTYTGSTIINSGTVSGAGSNVFSPTSAVTVNTNGSLNLGSNGGFPNTQTINSVTLSGGTIGNGGLTGAITSNGGSINALSGSASLTVNSGNTFLNGSNTTAPENTYTGNTIVNGGTLVASGQFAFSPNSALTINTGGTVLVGAFSQTINNILLNGGTLSSGDLSFGSIVSDGGTITNIFSYSTLAVNSGTTDFTGSNTFSSITVNGGTINNTGVLNGPVTTNSSSSPSAASISPSRSRVVGAAAQTVSNNPANSARAQSSMLAPNAGVFNNAGWVTGSLLNNGQLNIIGNQSRISGPITGAGEINVNGVFRQESSISNGVINVNNGGALLTTAGLNAQSLNIKGGGAVVAASDITAPINVANGGTLTSSGLRNINGDVRNAGDVFLLTPGDKLNVNGAYSQAASGRFTTVIGSTEKYGKVESAQNLNIENGSTINAVIDRRLRPTSGTVYSAVLKGADAPFQSQINVLTNTPRYDMSAVWNGNQVDLHVSGPYLGALADQTLSSISAVQGPTLNALHQRYAVLNAVMEYDCNKFDKLNFCISAQARTTGFGTQTTGAGVFNIAYRPTNETRIGAYLDYQVAAGNPSTYGPSTAGTLNTGSVNYGYDNATFGGYLGYSQSGYSGRMVNTGVQAIVSGGYNPGKMVTTRALTLDPYGFDFIDSQPGSGTASLNAYYARGLLGYGYALTDKATLMPYLGVRYTDVSRGGYMEGFNAAVTQPLVFNAYYERLVTGFGGMMLNGQMTDQFGVTAGLGTELDFSRAASNFGGYSPIAIQGLTAFGFQHGGSWNGFRPTGTVGAYYDVMPNHRVSLNGYAGQQAWSSRTYTTGLLGYQIAF